MKRHRNRRVLMLIENGPYSWDGRVRREANALTAAGCEVVVICRQGPGEGWREQFGAVKSFQYPPPPNVQSRLGYVFEYAYALAMTFALTLWVAVTRGFDVIHAHNPPDLFVLIGMIFRIFGKKFVFDHHDLAPEMYLARYPNRRDSLIYRLLLYFERLSFRTADFVISANDSYKQVAITRGGISADRVAVVRNGPEPCHLNRVEPESALVDPNRILIGFVGDMGPQDGVEYLLNSLVLLKQEWRREDWRCVLVGDGSMASRLKQSVDSLGLSDHVIFTGWLDYRAVPRYISAMDICVAPDPSNGYSDRSTVVKLMEYMAQAKPMVLFDLPEHRVSAGEAALYATPNDVGEFSSLIARLMDDLALRRNLGQIGRARVVNSLAWSHQERRLLAVYEKLFAPGWNPVPALVDFPRTECPETARG